MDRIAIESTAVVVLADGDSAGEISNRRGHLFEAFVAQLLGTQGYAAPRTERLNIRSDGIELDVEAEHNVTKHRLLCECKAYSSNLPVPMVTGFVGKFAVAKAKDADCRGLFIGLPRLTSDALAYAREAEAQISGFRYLGSYEVCELLANVNLLPDLDGGPSLKADPTLVISEHGLAMAAKSLDPNTRNAQSMVVWNRAASVPQPLLRLVEAELADGLPVVAQGTSPQVPAVPLRAPQPPVIVEVQGSSSDFEYQFPTSPAFFVGRKGVTSTLKDRLTARERSGSVVINAKSGWGKSSLNLKLKDLVEKAGGVAMVVDVRTAERPDFVVAALEKLVRAAAQRRILTLPEDAAFTSVTSAVETVRAITWRRKPKPLLLAFDQFENVFQDWELTREFRDLALAVSNLPLPLTIGFAWKTDMVGWTEDHPYALRDAIRDTSEVFVLAPFGAREVETLLRRLENALGEKIQKELRQRLREYSQGLPWLLKKLAGHILSEVRRGVSQEELARQLLNVQVLFEEDLGRLSSAEQQALRMVARRAPVAVGDIDPDVLPSKVLDSLVHQRLVVQVGERLDIYWDTFRDFLNTGTVAIQDSYVVRYAPQGAAKLLRVMRAAGGELSVPDAALDLDTSVQVVFNYARELRLFGVLNTAAPNTLVLEDHVRTAKDPEEAVRSSVAAALRRHKMHSLSQDLMARLDGPLPISELAATLPAEFPTVEAKADSWFTYARSFCQWMEYAGMVTIQPGGIVRRPDDSDSPLPKLLSGSVPVRVRSAFPGGSARPAVQLLKHLVSPATENRPSDRRVRSAARDLSVLGVVELDDGGKIRLTMQDLVVDGVVDTSKLRGLVEAQPGLGHAFGSLEENPAMAPGQVGTALRRDLGADWADSTTHSIGKYVRSWARACGIETRLRPVPEATSPALWDDE